MNEERAPIERQLALEIRSGRFGFAVIEGSTLLDWGACAFDTSGLDYAMSRLAFLLRIYRPATVVARTTRRGADDFSKNAAKVLRKIRNKLERGDVRFVLLARHDVHNFFSKRGCGNKHEIAGVIADRFSQLKARVPKLRKPWDCESAITAVFDAIASVMAADEIQVPG